MFEKSKSTFKINFRPIVVIFLSFLFGIACARKLYSADVFFVVLVTVVLLSILVYSILKRKFVFLALAFIFFFIGNGSYFLSYNSFLGKEFSNAQITGRVTDDITKEDGYYRLVIENVSADGEKVNNVTLYVWNPMEEIEVGDVVTYTGDLENVKLFTLNSFNTNALRSKVAYTSSVDGADLVLVSGGKTFDEKARAKIKEVLFENMSEYNAGVAFAVLTGDKTFVDETTEDAYRYSGIIHILTVSGLHVTFLIGLIAWVLKRCKVNRFVNFVLTFCLLLIYAYICGFAPSILRAMIMGLVLIAAGLMSIWTVKVPDVMADADGEVFAVRDESGKMVILPTRGNNYLKKVWLEKTAARKLTAKESRKLKAIYDGRKTDRTWIDMACDERSCLYKKRIRIIKYGGLEIDGKDYDLSSALGSNFYIDGKNVTVKTVRGAIGRRLWNN